MDMQNVSNLQIPEGEVKTIHSRDGRLLWGGLGYDTKYAGDTTQATYTGKNLFASYVPFRSSGLYYGLSVGSSIEPGTSSNVETTVDGDTITVTTKAGWNGVCYRSPNLPNGTYTLSFGIGLVNWSGSQNGRDIYIVDANNVITNVNMHSTAMSNTTRTITLTGDDCAIAISVGGRSSTYGTFQISKLQIEAGSTKTSYEPYTGGAPSPSPNYPQPVNVVTGAQTVAISDSIDSVAFPISLGSIELCKIGDHQDYIYKSGSDWYVHKSVKKINLNGAETWQNSGTNTFACSSISDYATSGNTGFSPFAKGIGNVENGTVFSNTAPDQSFAFGDGTIADRLYWKSSNFANANEAKSWLQSNTPDLYYALTTPTDTKITNATLVEQLNAVHQWATRYGYNATVSGDLPIVLQRDSLQ